MIADTKITPRGRYSNYTDTNWVKVSEENLVPLVLIAAEDIIALRPFEEYTKSRLAFIKKKEAGEFRTDVGEEDFCLFEDLTILSNMDSMDFNNKHLFRFFNFDDDEEDTISITRKYK